MNWNAYHFVGETLRDGTPVPADGVTLKYDGEIKLCASGFHASREAWQALDYAPATTLCRVHCAGKIITGDDKLVCTERTIIARIDAEQLLRKFARKCAGDVIHLWDAPDVVVEYLKTGNEELRDAARDAAWDTLSGGVNDNPRAAWDVARKAAAAAWGAAWDARWASWDARWAARDARWAARWDAGARQRSRFTQMVNAEFNRI